MRNRHQSAAAATTAHTRRCTTTQVTADTACYSPEYMSFLSIRDLDLNGKCVFIRVDFNVPLQKNERGEMEITSDKRIKASLPTIQYAIEHGAGVILASHL